MFQSDYTAQEMKFSTKDFFSKCDQIRRKLRIWLHLLKKSLMENFLFCVVWDANSRKKIKVKVISLNSCGRKMRYMFFFLSESQFLGSRVEILKKFSTSCAISYVKSRSKSVKTTRPYHKCCAKKKTVLLTLLNDRHQ